jgi:hypothetical protein
MSLKTQIFTEYIYIILIAVCTLCIYNFVTFLLSFAVKELCIVEVTVLAVSLRDHGAAERITIVGKSDR